MTLKNKIYGCKEFKRARLLKDLSQREMAARCDCHVSKINSIELGYTEPDRALLIKIAEILDASLPEVCRMLQMEEPKDDTTTT